MTNASSSVSAPSPSAASSTASSSPAATAGRVVDTHVHAGLTKYEPVESLLDQMSRHRVDHAVLVQHAGIFDNTYLIECAQRFPGRFAVACAIDDRDPAAGDHLAAWVERSPSVQGVRLYLRPLLEGAPGAAAAWQRAHDLGLIITVAGGLRDLTSDQMPGIVERYHRARLHLEHLAHPDPKEPAPYETYRRALGLARYPHVSLKASGFYSFTQEPWSPYVDTLRFVDLALEAFGARRMMWGSDFPPVSGREGYHNALRFATHHIPLPSYEDRAYLLGRTALGQWRFDLGA